MPDPDAELARWDAELARVAGKPHGDPDHSCSWACPGSDPLADVRVMTADIGAGLTIAEITAKHERPGPFSFGPNHRPDEMAALLGGLLRDLGQ